MTEKNKIAKVYIGDGVYADFEDGMIKLTTENGVTVFDTIYLEEETYSGLLKFVSTLPLLINVGK